MIYGMGDIGERNEYRVAYWGYEANIDSPIINATPDNCPFFKLEEIYENR